MKYLLDQASECPVDNPPPMTMIINIPERVLLIKVTRMAGASGQATGYVLVFHDVTSVVSVAGGNSNGNGDTRGAPVPAGLPIRLRKIPTVQGKVIDFVDVEGVISIRSDGHYTRVLTTHGNRFCNLAIGELETRLDPQRFMRVHRSHIANLGAGLAAVSRGRPAAAAPAGRERRGAGLAHQPGRTAGAAGPPDRPSGLIRTHRFPSSAARAKRRDLQFVQRRCSSCSAAPHKRTGGPNGRLQAPPQRDEHPPALTSTPRPEATRDAAAPASDTARTGGLHDSTRL